MRPRPRKRSPVQPKREKLATAISFQHQMPCEHTRGFISLLHRTDHFLNHGARLGITTEEDYEMFADRFLKMPCPDSALQFVR